MNIPRSLPWILDHAVEAMEQLGGNTWFAEDGDVIVRVDREGDVLRATLAERSTIAGQDILIDAQRQLAAQR